jgi:hypothetical protein
LKAVTYVYSSFKSQIKVFPSNIDGYLNFDEGVIISTQKDALEMDNRLDGLKTGVW